MKSYLARNSYWVRFENTVNGMGDEVTSSKSFEEKVQGLIADKYRIFGVFCSYEYLRSVEKYL